MTTHHYQNIDVMCMIDDCIHVICMYICILLPALLFSSLLVTVPDVPILAGSSGIITSSVTYGSASYQLDWTAPSNTGGSAITSYTVTCTSGSVGTISGTNPITSTITNLAGGVPVTCTVKANNAQGASNGVTTNSFTPGNKHRTE